MICDTESMQYFPNYTFEIVPPYSMQEDECFEGEYEHNEMDGHIIGAFKECLEEIDYKGKELFKKFVSNIDTEIPLGRFAREAIGESRASDFLGQIMQKVGKKMKAQNNEDFVYTDRGASIDKELSEKLERFKVKTVNIGGVVKEEQK